MTDNKKSKAHNIRKNVLETLKDLGSGVTSQAGDLAKTTTEDFFRELIGIKNSQTKKSGELKPGDSFSMNQAENAKNQEENKLKNQISFERNLHAEEMRLTQEKMDELRVQLQAISFEIRALAQSTGSLATQTEIAMLEVPANPGIYHIIFFEKVLEFLKSFRKKIDMASVWLESTNKRSQKKNYWSMYKSKGSSFLLSPDHFLQRSAG